MLRRILHLLCLVPLVLAPVAHAGVSVSASVESGTYERVFSVRLTVSDPTAKLFYTFEPDGSPMDAYAYTGAIRVERSTPLLYFAFTDPANESPIYRQDYELRYPMHLSLSVDPAGRVASLMDYSADPDSSVALDGWRIEKDDVVLHEFAASDFARAGEGFAVSYALPSDVPLYGEYSLVAPDDTVVATHIASEPAPSVPVPTVTYGPSYESATQVETPPGVIVPTQDVPTEIQAVAPPMSDEPADMTPPEVQDSETQTQEVENTPPAENPDDTAIDEPIPVETIPTEVTTPQTIETSAEPVTDTSTSPDVTASARSFGGLLPIAFMFLLALAASAWRAMRVVAASPKKLR